MQQQLRRLSVILLATSICVCSSSAIPATALAGYTPRDMFYQDVKQPENPQNGVSVAYCLELHRGSDAPVLANNRFPFKSGDAVRLHVKSSAAAYAYIALIGSSGKKAVLYPPPGSTEDNRLEAGKEYVVPANGQIVFDNQPGTEQLFVILTKDKQDVSAQLNSPGALITGDTLSGLSQKVGDYKVISNDGFYELGKKAPGSGLVFVNNPDGSKPTVIAVALMHSPNGSDPQPQPTPQPQPNPVTPTPAPPSPTPPQPAPPSNSIAKVRYDIRSLHNDGLPRFYEESEVWGAFHKTRIPGSGIDGGQRDQFIAGVNHLYANWCNQAIDFEKKGSLFYVQIAQGKDSGERVRQPDFEAKNLNNPNDKNHVWDFPGFAGSPVVMGVMSHFLSGGRSSYLALGGTLKCEGLPKEIFIVETGQQLDAAWVANHEEPLIVAVKCSAKMFQPSGEGGHVVVLSERRDAEQPGKSSKYEYRLLNQWGKDNDGRPRNGWVTGDAMVSAMNYTDAAHDDSLPPHKALQTDALPLPGANPFARGDDGFISNPSMISKVPWPGNINNISNRAATATRSLQTRDVYDLATEQSALLRNIADGKQAFKKDEQALCESAIKALVANQDEQGKPRRYQISQSDLASIFHDVNRLFLQADKITAQGLDLNDRNRAVVALLHDNANIEHMNQGFHNTCNVTTIMKVECFLRPAPQVKRFVDLYTNANGDQTVDMPKI